MLFWKDPACLSFIFKWAQDIDAAYPDAHIVGIGNSPAVLVAAVGEIRAMRGKRDTALSVAFTGSYFNDADGEYRLKSGKNPTPEMLAGYKTYLESHNTSADEIVRRYREHGTKTVFMDVVMYGRGLVSFYDCVARTAINPEAFVNSGAVTLCGLTTRMSSRKTQIVHRSVHSSFGRYGAAIETRTMATRNDSQDRISGDLMGCRGYKDHELWRLVPSYPMTANNKDHSTLHDINPSYASRVLHSVRCNVRGHMRPAPPVVATPMRRFFDFITG